jgi:hypothetical protein
MVNSAKDAGPLKMKRQHTYGPVNRCIYCGATDSLTDEHIIPHGLGGALLLPKSSCAECSKETHAFEGRYMGGINRIARRLLKLPQKNAKAKSKKRGGPETFGVELDGIVVKVEAGELPGMLVMFTFDPPGLLLNQESDDTFTGRISIAKLPGYDDSFNKLMATRRKRNLTFPAAENADDTGRLLAKIAHSYTAAELGLASFEPFLVPAILNQPPLNLTHFVGGLGSGPISDELHTIEISNDWDPLLVVVQIQLFTNWGGPRYLIVAGKRPPIPAQS